MICRTYSGCDSLPDGSRPSTACRHLCRRLKKTLFVAAALLLHAVAVISILYSGSAPLRPLPSAATLAVSILTENAAGVSTPETARTEKAVIPPAKTIRTAASGIQSSAIYARQASAFGKEQENAATDERAPAAIVGSAVGSGVKPGPTRSLNTNASIPASYAASNRKPEYPLLARRHEEQGTVILRILVKADGRAGKIQVTQSSGYPLLDESARSAVESWRFQPASRDNVAIAEWYQVAIPFTLYD